MLSKLESSFTFSDETTEITAFFSKCKDGFFVSVEIDGEEKSTLKTKDESTAKMAFFTVFQSLQSIQAYKLKRYIYKQEG